MYRTLNIAILVFCLPLICFALPEDSKQSLHIVADSQEFNYKTGMNLYEGNVVIDQGTQHLAAERVVAKHNTDHKIEEAIAYGIKTLAIYSTLPKAGDPPLTAKAKIIKFYPLKAIVILEGDVIVTQGENSFHGPTIIYNIKDQIVTAPASKTGRATITIEPDKLKS